MQQTRFIIFVDDKKHLHDTVFKYIFIKIIF